MGLYALIKSGKVINTIVWDGPDVSPMDLGDGVSAVELQAATVQAGYLYKDGNFTAPPLSDSELATVAEDARMNNINAKDSMMAIASLRINILQDAVDFEMATDEESLLLPLWRKYRVLLSRVDANTTAIISWPKAPE